ncbi:hypothetical protein C1X30_04530 [Pseudomonas sp. FW305-BF6]|nr:hypothetical protein C1X28_02700 [Pseudomonas sp. FW305-BF15]PNB82320.1 hypothetical protein C1X30_04530 [Pseudomonas sp. FW305-BF6]
MYMTAINWGPYWGPYLVSLDKSTPLNTLPFSSKHGDLFSKHFDESVDEQTMILKAHLLVEEMLRDFCISSVVSPQHLLNARLSFSQTVHLAQALFVLPTAGLYMWPLVKHLNKMRNLMAHELEPNAAKYDECHQAILSIVQNRVGNDPDASRYEKLGSCLSFLCGSLSAALQISLSMAKES